MKAVMYDLMNLLAVFALLYFTFESVMGFRSIFARNLPIRVGKRRFNVLWIIGTLSCVAWMFTSLLMAAAPSLAYLILGIPLFLHALWVRLNIYYTSRAREIPLPPEVTPFDRYKWRFVWGGVLLLGVALVINHLNLFAAAELDRKTQSDFVINFMRSGHEKMEAILKNQRYLIYKAKQDSIDRLPAQPVPKTP